MGLRELSGVGGGQLAFNAFVRLIDGDLVILGSYELSYPDFEMVVASYFNREELILIT